MPASDPLVEASELIVAVCDHLTGESEAASFLSGEGFDLK